LGTQVGLLLGHGLFDRVHVADRPAYLTALSDAAMGGEARSVEFRLRRDTPNDRQQTGFIWVEMRCKPLEQAGLSTGSSQAEVVGVIRDITDRKIQEQALEVARTASEQADAAKTRFLATMSHELRTPLNAIIGFSEMIAQEEVLMLDGGRRKEYAQLINDSGQHLLSVVNGILDMSKMEAGNFEICPEPFDPRAALINSCSLLALKASENGIELVTRVSEDVSPMTGDPRAFKQVVLNLVSNAIKFSERGGKVTVSAAVVGSRLVLRVSDTGVGIAPEDIKRIGDPFFQAGKTYQRRHEGTGLGLSIVKRLVALHGGDLTLRSKIDHGTTVTVALPIAFASILPKIESERSSNIATLSARSPAQCQPDQVKRSA
jgi:two-component system, cell cycle sensor histidine kinase DivJ